MTYPCKKDRIKRTKSRGKKKQIYLNAQKKITTKKTCRTGSGGKTGLQKGDLLPGCQKWGDKRGKSGNKT